MAYGRKNIIKLNPLNYNIGLIGEGGIGKTTVVKEMCEKLVGSEGWDDDGVFQGGYLFLECGKEDGADAITDINFLNCPDWNSEYDELNNSIGFNLIVEDIIENKEKEYPNLKTVIVDTYDQLRQIVEPEVIRLHNRQYPDKKVTSIKAAFGGYMSGEDMCDDIILNKLWELKKVGVQFIIIGHVKLRDNIVDPINGDTYSQLTTDMSMRSFNKIKTKLHFLGVAAVDREISKEKKNGKEKNVVKSESRRITFRDDNYAIDSKSRFADIVDEIPLDSDALIKALTDAIIAEANKGNKSIDELKKYQESTDKLKQEKASEVSKSAKENKIDTDRNEELKEVIQSKFSELDKDKKTEFKNLMTELEIENFKDVSTVPTLKLEKLAAFFN